MYQIHPIAQIFPRMPGEEFVALKKDIHENGLIEPVWIYEGMVLDGRHRYYACQETGVDLKVREYEGDDPAGFAISLNLKRRHLDSGQRAMIAAGLENMQSGRRTDLQPNANLHEVSRIQAAEMLNVSPRSVATAAKVERDAPAEVAQAVKAGAMSLNLAAQVAELPFFEQEIVSAAPIGEIKNVALEAINRAHVANNSGNNEWYTPSDYIDIARQVMGGIDTDPATSEIANKTVCATRIFTAEDDGREKTWSGNVWMNPPYSQPLIMDFSNLVASKYDSGEIDQACILVNNATETQWFQRLLSSASAVCFPRSRIRFVDPDGNPSGSPLQGQAVVYMGRRVDLFKQKFTQKGPVLLRG